MFHFECCCFGHLRPEVLSESSHIIREDRRLMAGAGDSDVPEAGTEQVRMNAGIGVNEYALGGEPLGAVAGDGVAVIEMPVFGSVEFNPPIIIEPGADPVLGTDGLDHGKIPVGDAKLFVRRSELDSVAN